MSFASSINSISSAVLITLRSNSQNVGRYVNRVVFGPKNLLLTNALISAALGAAGDSIQQNYDILTASLAKKTSTSSKKDLKIDFEKETKYCTTRTWHMTAAGLTTGITTHYWYILLDRFMGIRKTPFVLGKKVLIDQIIFSPINLFVYFTTLSICERSSWHHLKAELIEKGMENIYIAEWFIWPPAQLINFAWLPLRYRILFDNFISLGFDIYSPYVKYKTQLSEELPKELGKTDAS